MSLITFSKASAEELGRLQIVPLFHRKFRLQHEVSHPDDAIQGSTNFMTIFARNSLLCGVRHVCFCTDQIERRFGPMATVNQVLCWGSNFVELSRIVACQLIVRRVLLYAHVTVFILCRQAGSLFSDD